MKLAGQRKTLLLVILLISVLATIFAALASVEGKSSKDLEEQSYIFRQTADWEVTSRLIAKEIESSNSNLRVVSKHVIEEIGDEYLYSKDRLKEDLANPSSEKDLYKILRGNVEGVYVNYDNGRNNIMITNRQSVLLNLNVNGRSHTLIKPTDGRGSFEYAIYQLNTPKDYMLYSTQKNHTSVNLEELKEEVAKYGVDVIKSYYLLVPTYITNTGDILGTKDYDNVGKPNKTFKLILIQQVSLYDVYSMNKEYFDATEAEAKVYMERLDNAYAMKGLMNIAVVLILFSTIIALAVFYNTTNAICPNAHQNIPEK